MKKSRRSRKGREYRISKGQWRRFNEFLNVLPDLEEVVTELEDAWDDHVTYLKDEFSILSSDVSDMREVIQRVRDAIFNIIETPPELPERHFTTERRVVSHSQVTIEDISDGKL